MAEIRKRKTRMYEPWGYQEENNYESSENQFEIELNGLFASAKYDDTDKKIHFFNNDGEEISGSSIDTTEFAPGVIEDAYYDPITKELVIVFDNGTEVRINMAEIVDEYDFADGLQVDSDGIVSVKIDAASEPYLTVGPDGIKLSGIDALIEAERQRAISAETALEEAVEEISGSSTSAITELEEKVDEEIARALSAETALDEKIEDEKDRAISAETALSGAITDERDRAISAETALNDKIDQEIARATSAETVLDNKITAEEARAKAAESALTDALNAEIARSKREDELHDDELRVLDSRIDLTNAKLDAEIARSTSADTVLDNKIEAEKQRAISAETELEEDIDDIRKRIGHLKSNTTLEVQNVNEASFGTYNDSQSDTTFSIGIGTAGNRKNAIEVKNDGKVYMWIENDYMDITDLLAQIAHETYDDDDPPFVFVNGITLDKSSITIAVGNTDTLTPTVTPSNASDPSVVWESSDESVAKVDENGVVTAIAIGTATITAMTLDGGFTATCEVTVEAQPQPTIGITYTAANKLNVDLTAFTPAATAETFADGVGKIEFANDVTAIGEAAFSQKDALTSIVIPDSVTTIGEHAFEWCDSLTICTIGSGVTSIGGWAFYHCIDLTNIDIPSGVTSIGICAFDGCTSLTSIDIPSGVTSISDTTFNSCTSLTSVTIPNSVTSIGNQAFKGCTSLTSVTIPNSVTSINYYVFSGCTSLTSITCEATTPPTLRSGAFNNTNNCPIYVPSASVNTYKTASGWSTYSSRIQPKP